MTTEEQRAIDALKKLAKRWPSTLWLFSGSGDLHVMRYRDDGSTATLPDGGMDPAFIVESIGGMNAEGGDW